MYYSTKYVIEHIAENGNITSRDQVEENTCITTTNDTVTIQTEKNPPIIITKVTPIGQITYEGYDSRNNPVLIIKSAVNIVFVFKNEHDETESIWIFR